MNKVVVLDRDGTIIVDKHYLADPSQVELIPNAAEGMRKLQDMGWGLVVITNQSGVGRGYFSENQVHLVHEKLKELLARHGVHLDGVFYCPHTPEEDCSCRKPRSGLLELAARELAFVPCECLVVGDKACDIGLAHAVGARAFLVRTGYGKQEEANPTYPPDYVVDNLLGVAQWLKQNGT